MNRGIHTLPNQGQTDEWLTPPEVLEALGPFDLDPCSPIHRPWDTAAKHYSILDDGLRQPWEGRVWLNPPYGSRATQWVKRLAEHGDGIALLAARCETKWFHDFVWNRADAVLFLKGRLYFHKPDGQRGDANSGHPSVLVAYGIANAVRLSRCGIPGAYTMDWQSRGRLGSSLAREVSA